MEHLTGPAKNRNPLYLDKHMLITPLLWHSVVLYVSRLGGKDLGSRSILCLGA